MAAEDNGRISVSRDALRAELVTMELRLVEKLATKTDVDALRERVIRLEKRAEADDAVRREDDGTFSKREKIVGLFLALAAVVLQTLLVTGVFR